MAKSKITVLERWLSSQGTRRGLCAGLVALSFGGLVLERASGAEWPVPAGSPARGVVFAGPHGEGSFAPSASKVLANGGHVLVELRLKADAARIERAPISMVVLLDTSGSMDGGKLDDAKRSIARMLAALHDEDRVALVRYDSNAELIVPLTDLAAGRARLGAALADLSPDGGTNISAALNHGLDALGAELKGGRVKRMVLVSDGLDEGRAESQRIAARAASHGVTVSSLGIGLDFDEGYLAAVAAAGQGNFGFAEDAARLQQFLERESEYAARTAIEGAVAELDLAPGLELVRAYGIDGVRSASGHVTVPIGAIAAGQERRIVVELATSERATAERLSIDATVAWSARSGESARIQLARTEILASADSAAVAASRDPRVWASALEVMARAQQLDAAAAYSRGDHDEARQRGRASIDLLEQAAASAPSARAAAIENDGRGYRDLQQLYEAPGRTDEGRAAAKRAAERAAHGLTNEE